MRAANGAIWIAMVKGCADQDIAAAKALSQYR
jgi:hypothetical protein